MILQQLYKDAELILQQTTGEKQPPPGYVREPVRWYVDIVEGKAPVLQILSSLSSSKKRDTGVSRLVPWCKRTSGPPRPYLFCDDAAYVFSLNYDPKKSDAAANVLGKHRAFVDLAKQCAEKTNNKSAQAVVAFLESFRPDSPPFALPVDINSSDSVTFKVNGRFVIDEPDVQEFWAAVTKQEKPAPKKKATVPEERQPMCLLSGEYGLIESTMPITVKGLMGGHMAGTHIVSGNFNAMESHGWTNSRNSPISRKSGERFGQALNALLASPEHYRRVANSTYLFWVGAESPIPLPALDPELTARTVELLLDWDVQTVSSAFDAPYAGERFSSDINLETPFYIFGITPNVSRIAVRTALSLKVGELIAAQQEWFKRLKVPAFDEKGKPVNVRPLKIKALAGAGYRDLKDIPAAVEDALVRCALQGPKLAPLPISMLHSVVLRCRAQSRVFYPQAALMKFILTQADREAATLMESEVTGALPQKFDTVQSTAYHLGRLFAELEAIQRTALSRGSSNTGKSGDATTGKAKSTNVNASVTDKFYGSAAATPASVFGILLARVQNHLTKLRKDKPGAFKGSQERLESILQQITPPGAGVVSFPKHLTLEQQALFSLGYYHHRAEMRRQQAEAQKRKTPLSYDDSLVLDDDAELSAEGDE